MKKVFAIILAAALLLSLTGCEVWDYRQAMNSYNNGDLSQAWEGFSALGDFADSAAMAARVRQELDYSNAQQFFQMGDYRKALDLYEGLELYMDSPMQAVECQYRLGLGCLESGAYEEAISWLEPLGNYQGSSDLVLEAKWLWLHEAVVNKGNRLQVRPDPKAGFVYLTANEDGTLTLSYENEGQVLGMPFESNLIFTLTQGEILAPYTALYSSTSTSHIREEAAGTADISQYDAAASLPVDSFSQVNVDPDGTETISVETADALVMQTTLMEANAAIAAGLPMLLAQAEVAVTAEDLGFALL